MLGFSYIYKEILSMLIEWLNDISSTHIIGTWGSFLLALTSLTIMNKVSSSKAHEPPEKWNPTFQIFDK